MFALLAVAFQWVYPFLAVDFLGGFVHWFYDTYGSVDTPIIGKLIIGPNAEHHRRPMAFCKGTFWSRNSIVIYAAAVLAATWWAIGLMTVPWALAFAMGAVSNEIHYFTHCQPRLVPRLVKWLQRARILQTRHQHLVGHHKNPFDGCYCICLNVTNPLLDGVGFWRFLEAGIQAATGRRPRAAHP